MFENFASNIGQGLKVSIVGLIVVFVGLILLIGLVKLMTTINDRREAKKQAEKAAQKQPEPAPKPAAPAAPAPVPVEAPAPETDDSEIVAAIMAAINVMYEGTGKQPVLRQIRRSSKSWAHSYK